VALQPGSSIGAFQIHSLIGQGGMGEVYRARDLHLGRDVAIKVLPASFANGLDRLARFEREARTLATLNHPNIATVFAVERSGDTPAFVMELIEGEDLAQRLARGRIPVQEAIRIASQVAAALEAAHDVNVVHRDVKPANIRLRSDGTVKVVDFGLAKLTDGEPSVASHSPTVFSDTATAAGTILGTPAYMSPEQARGHVVDRRCDVWAFGCVLYEMLAGRSPFQRASAADTIAAVLNDEPEWRTLAETPAHVQVLVRRALRKDLATRLPHLGAARLDLSEAADAMMIEPRSRVRARWWLGGAAIAAALIAVPVRFWMPPGDAPETARFDLAPPPGTLGFDRPGFGAAAPQFSVSPDGQSIVFVADKRGGGSVLFVRSLSAANARELAGTTDASLPFFSFDGADIGYFAKGLLRRISVDGGEPTVICAVPAAQGGSWGPDGTIVFSSGSGLWKVGDRGGTPREIKLPTRGGRYWWPTVVGGGRKVLYLAEDANGRRTVRLHDLQTATEVEVIETRTRAVPTNGFLVFQSAQRLVARRFDEGSGTLSGEPVAITESVAFNEANSRAAFHVAAGTLVYRTITQIPRRLTWTDRTGSEIATVGPPDHYANLTLSHDGARLVAEVDTAPALSGAVSNAESDLWMFDLSRDIRTRLTSESGDESGATWTADDKVILFTRPDGIHAINLETGLRTRRSNERFPFFATNLIDDRLIVTRGPQGIWSIPLDPAAKPSLVVPGEGAILGEPRISPDRRWLAYTANEAGPDQDVYIRRWPATAARWRVSEGGASGLKWNPAGGELFYRNASAVFSVAVSLRPDGSPEIGRPRRLFAVAGNVAGDAYEVSRDGNRFLFAVSDHPEWASRPLRVVLNWPSTVTNR
jgi:eukaryotic-like serine/threonine-protein kinase